jgi:hypothetical protein
MTGTCPANTLVEVYKNEIFGGSTACDSNGNYKIDIDLLIGQNNIIARVYDALNQQGPDSNMVVIYYDALPAQAGPISSLSFASSQLIISTDSVYRGIFPGKEFSMPISILGGSPPYAVEVQWGDGERKVTPRNDNQSFNVAHTYKKAGTYQVNLQATDAEGHVAFLSVAVFVNGQLSTATTANTDAASTTSPSVMSQLLVLWPLYTSAIAIVISFWLGERREKQVLMKHGLLITKV